MTLADDGDVIISSIFETFIGHIQEIVKIYGVNRDKIPPFLRLFITDNQIQQMIQFIKDNIHDVPRYLKIEIAMKVKASLEQLDDMYIRSVMQGKPDAFLGEVLTKLNVMHFNGM